MDKNKKSKKLSKKVNFCWIFYAGFPGFLKVKQIIFKKCPKMAIFDPLDTVYIIE